MIITIFTKPPAVKGMVRLRLFVSIDGHLSFFQTKVKVLEHSWNQDKQVVDAKQIGYKEINGILTQRKAQLAQVFKDLDYNKIKPTPDMVRQRYNALINHDVTVNDPANAKPAQLTFFEYYDVYVSERLRTRSNSYLRQFKPIRAWLKNFNPKLNWMDINFRFYNDYLNHIIEGGELENNYISGHIKKIKTIMNAALKDPRTKYNEIPLDFEMFKDPYVDPKPIWLDWETEVRALEAFKPSAHDKIFLEEFLFRCYTGLRHSDVYNMNGANFIRRGNDIYLDFTSIKTKVDQNLRLTQKAIKILEGWDFNPPRLHIDKCNLAIKRICRDAGINTPTEKVRFSGSKRKADVYEKHELMATHVARRSFGRRWMENGGTLMRLSIFYGHSSEKITSKYIGWTTSEVNDEMSRVID